MKKKLSLICLIGLFLFGGCEKSNLNFSTDVYPTTYYKLDSDQLSQAKTNFYKQNKFIKSSLDEFGFCTPGDDRTVEIPPILDIMTEEEAIVLVKTFVIQNSIYTGVKNPEEFNFSHKTPGTFNDGSTMWIILASQQKIDTIEV